MSLSYGVVPHLSKKLSKLPFFEANRGKNQALYLYLPELLIYVKGITEIIFYFVFSFTVKEGFKKERRPIANKELLYQLSLLPHFLPHGVTVTVRYVLEIVSWNCRSIALCYIFRLMSVTVSHPQSSLQWLSKILFLSEGRMLLNNLPLPYACLFKQDYLPGLEQRTIDEK